MWSQIEPRRYTRKVQAVALIQCALGAFCLRLPSLEEILRRYAGPLGTRLVSTLSYALRRRSSAGLVGAMLGHLESRHRPRGGELVALDSMAVSLPSSRRHGCAKLTKKAVGGGVLWALCLQARGGLCPVKILKFFDGAWSDAKALVVKSLASRGPIYLMDRGFWAVQNVLDFLEAQVHFILRATCRDFQFTVKKRCGAPRQARRGVRILHDAIAWVGSPKRAQRPLVRLVYARLSSGESLILLSDQFAWKAERILEAYHQRWQIERFHRLLKETFGLAHLYSFQQRGLEFFTRLAVLLALLLLLGVRRPQGPVVDVLRALIKATRMAMGLSGTPWRRNTAGARIRPPRNYRSEGQNH